MTDTYLHPYHSTMLHKGNAEEITARINQLLENQFFTIVTANSFDVNSGLFSEITVRSSERQVAPAKLVPDKEYAHIIMQTDYGVMGLMTSARTIQEAHKADKRDYCYLHFEGRKLTIEHYAPIGYRLRWIFTIENHDRDY